MQRSRVFTTNKFTAADIGETERPRRQGQSGRFSVTAVKRVNGKNGESTESFNEQMFSYYFHNLLTYALFEVHRIFGFGCLKLQDPSFNILPCFL